MSKIIPMVIKTLSFDLSGCRDAALCMVSVLNAAVHVQKKPVLFEASKKRERDQEKVKKAKTRIQSSIEIQPVISISHFLQVKGQPTKVRCTAKASLYARLTRPSA